MLGAQTMGNKTKPAMASNTPGPWMRRAGEQLASMGTHASAPPDRLTEGLTKGDLLQQYVLLLLSMPV